MQTFSLISYFTENQFVDPFKKRYFDFKPPKEQLFSESQRFSAFAKLPSPFTKTTFDPTTFAPEIVDAHSINYEFSYQTTQPTTTTSTTTTTQAPLPPPPSTTEPSTTTTSTTSMYARFTKPTKPRSHMSMIIEGHSKVKTYGQGTAEDPKEKHKPKLVPILSKVDPVVRKVVNINENGETMEVQHLHTPPNPKKEPKVVKVTETSPKKEKSPPTAMDSLFSFFDSSFGGLLKDENGLTNEKEVFRKVRHEP